VIRANLLRLRRDRGLSLEALAQRAGIAVSVLEDLAAGRRFAGVELLWRLAQALGQPCTAFIELPGGPDEPPQAA
jgi:transcriptional regulator with XRE-family HTH domain